MLVLFLSDAKLALGSYGRHINLAGGHVKAFGVELEVMDQRFHRLLHLAALGRHHLAVQRGDGPVRHVAQALLDDADRLAAFLHPHHEAVVAIAAGADGNVEVHAVVHVIGLAFADIPGDARTADHRAGKAPRSEEHTSELQSLMRISYAVFCLKKTTNDSPPSHHHQPLPHPTHRKNHSTT